MIKVDLKRLRGSMEGDLPTLLAELEIIIRQMYDTLTEDIGDKEAREIILDPIKRAINRETDNPFQRVLKIYD